LVKFGTYTLPRVLEIQRETSRIFIERQLPGRQFAYRQDQGGLGLRFTVRGAIRPSTELVKNQIEALADGTARILDLEKNDLAVLEKCFKWQTGPVWTDNTDEAASPGGTPFTLLGAATDYHYFGHREKWNKVQFTLAAAGDYGVITWEYSKGNGTWENLDTLLDHFLGSSLDTTIWTLTSGTASVANSILTLCGDLIGKQSFGPYFSTTIRCARQDYLRFEIFIGYTDVDNYIQMQFDGTGTLYLVCKSGGVMSYVSCGAHDLSYHDYVVIWLSNRVRLFRDGTLVGTVTAQIPTAAGKFRFLSYGAATTMVDYIRYSYVDGTVFFGQSGTITLIPPSDWKHDMVNSVANKFWLRVSASSVTTAATVNQIQLNNVFNCIMLDPSFNETAENYNIIPYAATFLQVENP